MFQEWFWEKFEEWRRGTKNGPTAFARYLGIKQQYVSNWLDGKFKPRGKNIAKLAEKYPDVYEALGLPMPEPVDFRERLETALRVALEEIVTKGVDLNSSEGERIIAETAARFDIVTKRTDSA